MSTHRDVEHLQTLLISFSIRTWGGGLGRAVDSNGLCFPLFHFYKRKNDLQHIKNYSSAKTEKPFAGMIASTDRMPQTTL